MRTHETAESSQTPVVKATDKGKNVVQENQPQQQLASVASLSIQQLQDMIANSIRAKYGGLSQTSFTYSKSYTKRIDDLRMPLGKGTKGFPIPKVRKDKKETKGAEKIVKSTVKESMVVNTTPLKFSKRKEGRAEKKDDSKKQLIQLLKCKRPMQAEKVDDPNCCKYHRVINHLVEKYFVLKELILRLAREKKIELDLKEFGTFEPIVVQFHQEVAHEDSQEKERSIKEDDEGFLCDHQDENLEVVACHVINATKEESIPPRSLKEEGVSKDLLRFNVDDLLSLPQETKTILINTLLNSAVSSLSAPTATYERTPYYMSIDFSFDRILIDNGLAINIMPKSTIRQLGILMDELSNSKLVIQGFNQSSQRIIDSKFYLKNDNSPEVVPVEIPLGEATTSTTKSMILMDEKTSNPPILRYVSLWRHKKGESPFVKSLRGLKVGEIEVLKEIFTTPLTKITKQEIKIDLTEASLPQRRTKDRFNSKAYNSMVKADELKEVNLGTIEEPHPTFISASLSSEEEGKYMSLFIEYSDIFAWSYKEMLGLDPKVEVYHLAIKPGYRPIKQAQQHFRPELISQIEVEVNKLIEAGFIREVKYPTWIANIVPVRKKNGHFVFVMPFGLNVGVTYQCAMHRGIEIDQSKIDVLQKMPRPESLHDLKSLQGRLAYIRRFISNMTSMRLV
ncbi:uncharacterized protein E5676_scaffold595G00790 [Cucumis melo var. makuwa]|uniref:Ty3-gypsy retrotransposon protein n=1 Tax=Cucumis melo var. makuwa TaxID=1194695 RepID=A0A5D3E2Y5_CUCMM|nr:uncharacterized protein E5676_scaffold595G00790 [Cucumis melo var. makuwa]